MSIKTESKNYHSIDKLDKGDYSLAWKSGTPISFTDESFRGDNRYLYRNSLLPCNSDVCLGEFKAIFSHKKDFYLEFEKRNLKDGISHLKGRGYVKLKKKDKTLKLPDRYYLLRE
mgnify:FL=1